MSHSLDLFTAIESFLALGLLVFHLHRNLAAPKAQHIYSTPTSTTSQSHNPHSQHILNQACSRYGRPKSCNDTSANWSKWQTRIQYERRRLEPSSRTSYNRFITQDRNTTRRDCFERGKADRAERGICQDVSWFGSSLRMLLIRQGLCDCSRCRGCLGRRCVILCFHVRSIIQLF
jgi:hypothetical protein